MCIYRIYNIDILLDIECIALIALRNELPTRINERNYGGRRVIETIYDLCGHRALAHPHR